MNLRSSCALFLATTRSVEAFTSAPPSKTSFQTKLGSTSRDDENAVADAVDSVKGALSGIALAAALWTSPAMISGHLDPSTVSQYIPSSTASAKEMASGSGTRVNKEPESLLRYGLPIKNKEVRTLQKNIEEIRNDIASSVKRPHSMMRRRRRASSTRRKN